MDEWKQTVAANLAELRKSHHMTQMQLAEMLHYSDKAVSKWERGESLPDLSVMKQLADYYGITIDDFLHTPEERAALAEEQHAEPAPEPSAEPDLRIRRKNRLIIAGMAALLVWFLASTVFVVLDTVIPDLAYSSFLFMYAVPITSIVCLVFNSIWFNPRWNYAIISVLVWSVLGALYLTFYAYNIWKIFLIGIPAQLIIVLWSRLRPLKKPSGKDAE
jgi:transcriptional regulator with XRE-family HTH domain